ncbi:hypothetical protein WOB65_16825 [Vibrio parahaemolyticus]|nr:hypothetical protein [Vibrio parahaemolyticus]HCG8096423.1 hypothetical protein [Vibrio parahaemolyticus]HCH6157459.1 hypothetical protein [Vibrio parahaemolyticus]HCH6159632.1 hypothetical protein [Vibrio parahaemolyticus]
MKNLVLDSYTLDSATRILDVDKDDIEQLMKQGIIRACVSFDCGGFSETSLVFLNSEFDIDSLPDDAKLEFAECSAGGKRLNTNSENLLSYISMPDGEDQDTFQLSYFDDGQEFLYPELSTLVSTKYSQLNLLQLDLSDEDCAYLTGFVSGLWQIKSISFVKALLDARGEAVSVQVVPAIERALYYSTEMKNCPFIFDGFTISLSTSSIRLLREDVERIQTALENDGEIPPLNGQPWKLKASRVRPPSIQMITVVRQLIAGNPRLGESALKQPTKTKELIDQDFARLGLEPLDVGNSTLANWLARIR